MGYPSVPSMELGWRVLFPVQSIWWSPWSLSCWELPLHEIKGAALHLWRIRPALLDSFYPALLYRYHVPCRDRWGLLFEWWRKWCRRNICYAEKANELVKNGCASYTAHWWLFAYCVTGACAFAFDFFRFALKLLPMLLLMGKRNLISNVLSMKVKSIQNLAKLVGRTDIVSVVECYQMTLVPVE